MLAVSSGNQEKDPRSRLDNSDLKQATAAKASLVDELGNLTSQNHLVGILERFQLEGEIFSLKAHQHLAKALRAHPNQKLWKELTYPRRKQLKRAEKLYDDLLAFAAGEQLSMGESSGLAFKMRHLNHLHPDFLQPDAAVYLPPGRLEDLKNYPLPAYHRNLKRQRRGLSFRCEQNQKMRKEIAALWNLDNGKIPNDVCRSEMTRFCYIRGGKHGQGAPKALVARGRVRSFGLWFDAWVYYPKPEDAIKFAYSRKSVAYDSPGRNFPGSVGMLGTLEDTLLSDYEPSTVVDFLQGSFSFKKSPLINRSLVDRHGGWRQHLLNCLFHTISRKTVAFACGSDTERNARSRRLQEIFLSSAEKYGYVKDVRLDRYLIVRKQ